MKKVIALLLVFNIIFLFTGCDENKKPYKSAIELMENEHYSEAADAFAALGEYNDSAEKALLCKYKLAENYLKNNNIMDALEAFTELGEYSDSLQKVEAIRKEYFYENFGYIIPKFTVVRSDAQESKTTDSNGSYDTYYYGFSTRGSSARNELLDQRSEWFALMRSVEGIRIIAKGDSVIKFNIELNGKNIGSITNLYTANSFSISVKIENDYS